MNTYLLAAAVLTFFVGFIHSVLGEVMVFSKLRKGRWVPTNGGNVCIRDTFASCGRAGMY